MKRNSDFIADILNLYEFQSDQISSAHFNGFNDK